MPAQNQPDSPAHPWQRTVRTLVQVTLGLAVAAPLLYTAVTNGDPARAGGAVGAVLGAAAAVSRLMALPAVEQLLRRHAAWLSASDVEVAAVVARVGADGDPVAGDASPVTTGDRVVVTAAAVPAPRTAQEAVAA